MSTAQESSAPPEGGIILRRKKMRGGLGRTLLTAFLLLAIGPLSLVSLYAINRSSLENGRQQEELMLLQAQSIRHQIVIASQQLELSLLASNDENDTSTRWLFTTDGEIVEFTSEQPLPSWLDSEHFLTEWQVGGLPLALWVAAPLPSTNDNNKTVWQAQLLPLDSLLIRASSPSLRGARVYIQQDARVIPLLSDTPPLPQALIEELTEKQTDGIIYPSSEQQRLAILFSRTSLEDGLSLLLMLPSEDMQTGGENGAGNLAAALVAAALLAALGTTIAAAFITRRITRPLYDLTQAAVKIAQATKLKQRVQIRQDNELGILALAFNTMTDQLHDTLETLEERVAERTEALRQANAEIAERARRLELGAEIGTKLSRYHDLEELLSEGCAVIAKSFDYQDASILFLTYRNTYLPQASASQTQIAEQMLQSGQALFAEDYRSLALPLRVADNVLGALILTHKAHFEKDEQPHLQILADAFAVAIENARASEMERAALNKLEKIEKHRTEFLGEMSHELSTSLNAIIGFSQLMLREIEGPLTDVQRTDLTYINRNGTHLLSLLDGMLEVIDNERLES
jgi:signal transduction histidine kinase